MKRIFIVALILIVIYILSDIFKLKKEKSDIIFQYNPTYVECIPLSEVEFYCTFKDIKEV